VSDKFLGGKLLGLLAWQLAAIYFRAAQAIRHDLRVRSNAPLSANAIIQKNPQSCRIQLCFTRLTR
jgi:hypothetical protein